MSLLQDSTAICLLIRRLKISRCKFRLAEALIIGQEAARRQAAGLAKALSEAAILLNASRLFDAVCWKSSLEAIQLALPKSRLVNPNGEHHLLPLLLSVMAPSLAMTRVVSPEVWLATQTMEAKTSSADRPCCLIYDFTYST